MRTPSSAGRFVAALAVCLLTPFAVPQDHAQGQALAVSSFGRSVGIYTFRHMNGRRYEPGDSLRVRYVMYNVSDSTTAIRTHPCGFVITGTLDLTDVTGAGTCDPIVRQISPGDSVWAELTGVVSSPPGDYTIQLEAMSLPRYDDRGRSPPSVEISVVPFGTSPTSPRSSRFEPMMPKLPYVLRLGGSSSVVTSRDFDMVMESAVREFGFLPMHAAEAAADAIGEIWPYLLLELTIDERGQYELVTSWVTTAGGAAGSKKVACEARSNGLAARPVLLGAVLVVEIRQAMLGYVSGNCGV